MSAAQAQAPIPGEAAYDHDPRFIPDKPEANAQAWTDWLLKYQHGEWGNRFRRQSSSNQSNTLSDESLASTSTSDFSTEEDDHRRRPSQGGQEDYLDEGEESDFWNACDQANGKKGGVKEFLVKTPTGHLVSSFDFFTKEKYLVPPPVPIHVRKNRDNALIRHNLLDPRGRTTLDKYCQHAKDIFKADFAAVSMAQLDQDKVSVFSPCGAGLEKFEEAPLTRSVCAHAMLLGEAACIIPDRSKDWRMKEMEFGPGKDFPYQPKEGFRFYASAPLMASAPNEHDPEGDDVQVPVGRFCVIGFEPRPDFSDDDMRILENVAQMASEALERDWQSTRALKAMDLQRTAMSLSSKLMNLDLRPGDEDGPLNTVHFDDTCEELKAALNADCVVCLDIASFHLSQNALTHVANGWSDSHRASLDTSRHGRMSQQMQPEKSASSCLPPNGQLSSHDHAGLACPESHQEPPKMEESFGRDSASMADHHEQADNLPRAAVLAMTGSECCPTELSSSKGTKRIAHWLSLCSDQIVDNSMPTPQVYRLYKYEREPGLRRKEASNQPRAGASPKKGPEAQRRVTKGEWRARKNPFGKHLAQGTSVYVAMPIFSLDTKLPLFAFLITFKERVLIESWSLAFVSCCGAILQSSALRQKAKDSHRAQVEFIRQMSHELRTPLHGIIGMAAQLHANLSEKQGQRRSSTSELRASFSGDSSSYLTNENSWLINGIQFAGEDLRKALDDLLEFGDITGVNRTRNWEKAEEDSDLEDTDMIKLVESVAYEELKHAATRQLHEENRSMNGSASSRSFSAFPTLLIKADERLAIEGGGWSLHANKVRKILRQIISNAFRFADSHDTVVDINLTMVVGGAAEQALDEGNGGPAELRKEVEIAIRDNGGGMSMAFLQNGYGKPFAKANPFQQGSGLGSALAGMLLEQMEGSMKVESTVGEGTTVRVVIPLDKSRVGPSKMEAIEKRRSILSMRRASTWSSPKKVYFKTIDAAGKGTARIEGYLKEAFFSKPTAFELTDSCLEAAVIVLLVGCSSSVVKIETSIAQILVGREEAGEGAERPKVVIVDLDVMSSIWPHVSLFINAGFGDPHLLSLPLGPTSINGMLDFVMTDPGRPDQENLQDSSRSSPIVPRNDRASMDLGQIPLTAASLSQSLANFSLQGPPSSPRLTESQSQAFLRNSSRKAPPPVVWVETRRDGDSRRSSLTHNSIQMSPATASVELRRKPSRSQVCNMTSSGVTVPVFKVTETNVAPQSMPSISHPSEFIVLIVEDNPINMKLLVNASRKSGVSYVQAVDGLEAVTQFELFKPAVVLLDISLPEMDGFEAAIKMREISASWDTQLVQSSFSPTAAMIASDGPPVFTSPFSSSTSSNTSSSTSSPLPPYREGEVGPHDVDGLRKITFVPKIIAISALSSPEDIDRGINQCGMDEWRTKPANIKLLKEDLVTWKAEWELLQKSAG
ncbi:hypothetical protein IE53DRAFT_361370 [Violaceomyces palustris]|uniref:Uncharacterized protein n=1 Tax=Violaceomyces palustris TaxID=1673888 RepID=A0ACD0P0W3_9BASI|nr:hypothetical protein IE53DRAFT_361370 [Violaceomyces palustris]